MLTCRLENWRGLGDFESSVYTFSYVDRRTSQNCRQIPQIFCAWVGEGGGSE